jgi:hypothetical protein
MLPASKENRGRSDKREEETLKDFDSWRQERDRTVRRAKVEGSSKF